MTCVCIWCEEEFERTGLRGPVPYFCCPLCRQRAYEVRKRLKTKTPAQRLAWMQRVILGARA